MIYVTTRATPRMEQLTLEQILLQEVDVSRFDNKQTTNTYTRTVDRATEDMLRTINVPILISLLENFNMTHAALLETPRQELYETFHIPKKTGGLRRIDAPKENLKAALYQLKAIFETHFRTLYHTTAFAYVPGRNTVDVLKRHQRNESKWFLKLDFSNFFGSTTESFLFKQLSSIFPFSEVAVNERGGEALRKALSLCFLNGGLPQGTPISPLLTNLMMIPIDHHIANGVKEMKMVYTRYADDIIISSPYDFDYKKIERRIVATLNSFHAPFTLNAKKTHYGSSSGNNWCLGLMLNGNNEITIGWRNVDRFKAMCNSFILDCKNGVHWDLHDVQTFAGLLSYYKMVEKDYIIHIIKKYNEKYHVNMMSLLKKELSGSA